MDFIEIFKNGCFSLEIKSDTKEGIIEEMVDMLFKAKQIPDRQAILDAVFERENKMSTGMQFGIAIPHGKTDTIEELAVAFGLKKEGVDFSSLDGEPSNIFIMTISSANRTGPHIRYLAEISKLLKSPAIRRKLLAAQSREEVIKIFSGEE